MLIELIEKDDISNIEIIGSKSLPIYYTKSDLLFFLYDSKYIIYKASLDNIICGFLVGEIHDNRIHIMSIATDTDYRRKNVATNLINKIKEKYNSSIITLFVQQKNNFIAVFEEKNYYNNLQEKDAYFMAFSNNLNN